MTDGSYVHPAFPEKAGWYFEYDKDEWEQYFLEPAADELVTTVKQCRGGQEVWTGEIIIWIRETYNEHAMQPHGRRNDSPANNQWEQGDYIVHVSITY